MRNSIVFKVEKGRCCKHLSVPNNANWFEIKLIPSEGEEFTADNNDENCVYIDINDKESISLCEHLIKEIKRSIRFWGFILGSIRGTKLVNKAYWVSLSAQSEVRALIICNGKNVKAYRYTHYRRKWKAILLAKRIKAKFEKYHIPMNEIEVR